ncbi:hypothetical protein JOC45_003254 [Gordonia hydrophobica]|nr:hypothetical protein [Gordonia hydrophobica]
MKDITRWIANGDAPHANQLLRHMLVRQTHADMGAETTPRVIDQGFRSLCGFDDLTRPRHPGMCVLKIRRAERHVHRPPVICEIDALIVDLRAGSLQTNPLKCQLNNIRVSHFWYPPKWRCLVLHDRGTSIVSLKNVALSYETESIVRYVNGSTHAFGRYGRIHPRVCVQSRLDLRAVNALTDRLDPRSSRTEDRMRDEADRNCI